MDKVQIIKPPRSLAQINVNFQGYVLRLFAQQIREQHYVTITHKKMQRFFMFIREAAQLVI